MASSMLWYIGGDEAVLAGPLSVDLRRLPADADVSPSRGPLLVKLVLAALWFTSSLFFLAPFAAAPFQAKAIISTAPIAGLIMMGFFLYWLMRKRYVHFDRNRVSVRDRRWFRTTSWSAPYFAFEGVALRKQTIPSGPNQRTFHIVELKHPNPRLSLPLLVTSDGPPPRSTLEKVAHKLGLAALTGSGGDQAAETVDQLNRPLEVLARDNELSAYYDPDEPVPADIHVEPIVQDGREALEITLKQNRPRSWIRVLLTVGPPLVIAFGLMTGSWFIAIDGLTFAAIAAFVFWTELRYRRLLVITRDDISLKTPRWLFQASKPKQLDLQDIDGLYIRPNKSIGFDQLVIEGNGQRIETGDGLTADALDWLRRYLLAAIATA